MRASPAVVASTGVSMYLTKDAIAATLRQVAALAPGSTLAMSFMLPIELVEPEDAPRRSRRSERRARQPGRRSSASSRRTEMLALAREAGFGTSRHVSAAALDRALLRRQDGWPSAVELREELLVATT